jgi:Mn-dependent DtxR family transcriptional regulator
MIELKSDGLSNAAIASKLGVSTSAITKQLNKLPKELLEDVDVDKYIENKGKELYKLEKQLTNLIANGLLNVTSGKLSIQQIKNLISGLQVVDNMNRLLHGEATEIVEKKLWKDLPERDKKFYKDLAKQRQLKIVGGIDHD